MRFAFHYNHPVSSPSISLLRIWLFSMAILCVFVVFFYFLPLDRTEDDIATAIIITTTKRDVSSTTPTEDDPILKLQNFNPVVFYPFKFIPSALELQHKFCTNKAIEAKIAFLSLRELAISENLPKYIATYKMILNPGVQKEFPLIATHNPVRDVYISGELHQKGTWEINIFAFYKQALAKKMTADAVVVDCGANIGVFSICAAHAGWHVISIEASLENIHLLYQTSILNQNFSWNWEIVHAAVYDSSGHVVELTEHSNINHSNFVPKIITDDKETAATARTIRIDDMDMIGDRNVAILKIDVEGYEAHAIGGAIGTICQSIVYHIVMEMNAIRTEECNWQKMLRWLKRIGYEMYHDNGSPEPVKDNYWSGHRTWDCKLGCNVFFVLQNTTTTPANRLGGEFCYNTD